MHLNHLSNFISTFYLTLIFLQHKILLFCINNDKDNSGVSFFVGLIIFYTIVPIHIIIISIVDRRNYGPLLCIYIPNRRINHNTTFLKITFNNDIADIV